MYDAWMTYMMLIAIQWCRQVDAHRPRTVSSSWCTHTMIDVCRVLLHVVCLCCLFDAHRPQWISPRSDHGWIPMIDAHNPPLRMTVRCAQDTTDVDSLRKMSTEQCGQAITDAGDLWPMSHIRCSVVLVDISWPKHIGLGWCFLSHHTVVLQPMLKRHGCLHDMDDAFKPWIILSSICRCPRQDDPCRPRTISPSPCAQASTYACMSWLISQS